jgi:hypothetical protein
MNKQRVALNDLPMWSVWPARLLGLEPWTIHSRTIEKVDQEYDKDKYARCLDYYIHEGENITPEDIKQFEFGLNIDDTVCISRGNDLYQASLGEARAEYYRLLLNTLRSEIEKCQTVIELGGGYGYNLWMLKQHFPIKAFMGGEYSKNAVELASRLYQHDPKIRVLPFNFYDDQSYRLLEMVNPSVVVLTVHAIEQLQSSSPVLDALLQHRESIQSVFHFEPVYHLYDETLLGLMRRRYVNLNDYNKDLLPELQQRSYIRIRNTEANVFGLNPLNPTSVIHWEFSRV